MTSNVRIAWLRRESVLFLDEKTGRRAELPIPGQSVLNIPAYLRLDDCAQADPKARFAISYPQLRQALHIPAVELCRRPLVIAVPDDIQSSEEAMLLNFGITALEAKRVLFLSFSAVVAPDISLGCRNYASVTDTFRSVAVSFFDAQGRPSRLFLPYDSFDQAALNAALDRLCPQGRAPVYVDDLDGSRRWNHLGTPVGLEQALDRLRAALSHIK